MNGVKPLPGHRHSHFPLAGASIEHYIAETLGEDHLLLNKSQTTLREIKKEMATLRKRLDQLQARRTDMEKTVTMLLTETGDPEDASTAARRCVLT